MRGKSQNSNLQLCGHPHPSVSMHVHTCHTNMCEDKCKFSFLIHYLHRKTECLYVQKSKISSRNTPHPSWLESWVSAPLSQSYTIDQTDIFIYLFSLDETCLWVGLDWLFPSIRYCRDCWEKKKKLQMCTFSLPSSWSASLAAEIITFS